VRSTLVATIVAAALPTLLAQTPFDVGLARAARGELAAAAEAFQLAASNAASEADKARSRYNRGTVLVAAGALEEGIDELIQALRLNPDDDDARTNLTIGRARLARQPQPRSPSAEDVRRGLEGAPEQSLEFRIDLKRAPRRSVRDW
jgi:tetratricopeptide (TPR) repeat protein